MTQEAVRSVEFGGFEDKDPWVRVNGNTYHLGDSLQGRYGFDPEAVLGERLFRIAVALAIAAKTEAEGQHGWHTVEELVVSAEPLATPDAIRQFLTRSLCGYISPAAREIEFRGRVPNVNLIQYRPLRVDNRRNTDGRTRGPYRIGVPGKSITLDTEKALAFLGHSMVLLPSDSYELEEAITRAELLAVKSDYISARALILRSMFSPCQEFTGRGDYERIGRAYYYLGHYSMQLGLSHDAIRSARQTRLLFEKLRDSGWVASALVTESNAEGQLGNHNAALITAKRARSIWDNVDARRRRWMRTGRVGVVGQCYARLGNFSAAERNLLNAYSLAQNTGDALKIYTWTLRRAQNFLRQKDLIAAERMLSQARDFHARFAITGVEGAGLWRVTAEFMVAIRQWQEAARWAKQAMDFALHHRLQGEIRRLARLIDVIEGAAPDAL